MSLRTQYSYLSEAEFNQLSAFIKTNYGIKLPITKKVMLESRLKVRLRALNFNSFSEYIDYLFSQEGMNKEVVTMIDLVSTNKTDFYREPKHFDYMLSQALPCLYNNENPEPVKIWCAAASTGEEPYTIGITMEEFKTKQPRLEYSIFCTDISTRVLEKAIQGIYDLDRVEVIPLSIKSKYFLKSKDRINPTVRVIPELRKKLSFRRFNLIDDIYDVQVKFDIIFCRNVLIYFERNVQEQVLNKLVSKLNKNGFLFLGHSESLAGLEVPVKAVSNSVYQKTG